jgi:hypothetical protein
MQRLVLVTLLWTAWTLFLGAVTAYLLFLSVLIFSCRSPMRSAPSARAAASRPRYQQVRPKPAPGNIAVALDQRFTAPFANPARPVPF